MSTSTAIHVRFWNVNDDRRLRGPLGSVYPEYTFDARLPHIVKTLTETPASDILACFEVSKDSVPKLVDAVTAATGRRAIVTPYADDDGAFRYVTFYHPDVMTVGLWEHVAYTTSCKLLSHAQRCAMTKDEAMEHNYGTLFEKSAVVLAVTMSKSNQVSSNSKIGAKVENETKDAPKPAPFSGTRPHWFVVVTHIGLQDDHKTAVARILDTKARELSAVAPVIVGGDFNCFARDAPATSPAYNRWMFHNLQPRYHMTFPRDCTLHQGPDSDSGSDPCTFFAFPYDVERFMSPEERRVHAYTLQSIQNIQNLNDVSDVEEREALCDKVRAIHRSIYEHVAMNTDARMYARGWFDHSVPSSVLNGAVLDLVMAYEHDRLLHFEWDVVWPHEDDLSGTMMPVSDHAMMVVRAWPRHA